jgi:CO/xanthine dehydrogenase Mo-binding subunit
MKRALNMGDELAVVVQAETGGGFGGKEEYPSMIALHAALLALKCHKPVRMIYDRHEDISATTKRHPAVVRSRWGVSGHRRAGRPGHRGDHGRRRVLHADAGRAQLAASCTPAARIDARTSGSPAARWQRTLHPTEPSAASARPQTEFAAEMQVNRIADALDASPLDLRRRWVYREGDTTPTGQVLLESVGGIDVLEPPPRHQPSTGTRARRAPSARGGPMELASLPASASRWRGMAPASPAPARSSWHRSPVLELTDDGRIRILTASTEMGQGTKTIFPQLVADTLGVEYGEVEIAPQDTSIVPTRGRPSPRGPRWSSEAS